MRFSWRALFRLCSFRFFWMTAYKRNGRSKQTLLVLLPASLLFSRCYRGLGTAHDALVVAAAFLRLQPGYAETHGRSALHDSAWPHISWAFRRVGGGFEYISQICHGGYSSSGVEHRHHSCNTVCSGKERHLYRRPRGRSGLFFPGARARPVRGKTRDSLSSHSQFSSPGHPEAAPSGNSSFPVPPGLK